MSRDWLFKAYLCAIKRPSQAADADSKIETPIGKLTLISALTLKNYKVVKAAS